LGFRGLEYPEARRAGYHRIVVLGDSVAFGIGLPNESIFTSRLEETLRPERVEVMNLAVGGYDVQDEAGRLSTLGLRLKPDVVLVALCVNDLGLASPNLDYLRARESLAAPVFSLRLAQLGFAGFSALSRKFRGSSPNEDRRFANEQARFMGTISEPVARGIDGLAKSGAERLGVNDPLRWYASRPHVAYLASGFGRLAELSRKAALRVVVVPIPPLEPAKLGLWNESEQIIAELARENGLEFFSITNALSRENLPALRLKPDDPIHLNESGHRALARILLPEVRALMSGSPRRD
jgi:lysophospholipase L1-like esterase